MQTAVSASTSTLPQVNLLPPEIHERKRLQQVQAAVLVGVVLVAGGMAYLYYNGTHRVDAAKAELSAATSDNARLTRELAKYNDVKATAAELNASEALLTQATSTEVRWSSYLSDFGLLPQNSWMTSLTLTNSLGPGSLLTPSQAPNTVGSISVTGTSLAYPDLATWLDQLSDQTNSNQQNLLVNVYFSKAQEKFIGETKVVDFAASANVPSAGLSARCATPGSC